MLPVEVHVEAVNCLHQLWPNYPYGDCDQTRQMTHQKVLHQRTIALLISGIWISYTSTKFQRACHGRKKTEFNEKHHEALMDYFREMFNWLKEYSDFEWEINYEDIEPFLLKKVENYVNIQIIEKRTYV